METQFLPLSKSRSLVGKELKSQCSDRVPGLPVTLFTANARATEDEAPLPLTGTQQHGVVPGSIFQRP